MKPSLEEQLNQVVAIDTNILVRIFIIDDQQPQQNDLAKALVGRFEKIYVPQIVQVEFVWVLERTHGLEKLALLNILQELYENAAFILQNGDIFYRALGLYRTHNVGFSDCLILAESISNDSVLFTFDKKLLKLAGTKRVS